MSADKRGLSWGMVGVMWLPLMILWLGTDFLTEYKKNNMTEQDKAELVLQQKTEATIKEQQAKDEQLLLGRSFNEVKSEEKPTWIMLQLLNSINAKIALIFVVVIGFGVWYTNKKIND